MTDTTMQLLSQSTDPVKMPDFDILAEGETLSGVAERLMSLSLTDNRGFDADQLTITLDDVGESLRVAKGARGTGAAVVVGLATRLLNVKYERHGLYLQRHDLGAMELGHAQCRRNRITVGRGNATAGKDGQAIARILD